MRTFFNKFPVLSSILLAIVALGLLMVSSTVVAELSDDTRLGSIATIIVYALPIAFVVFMAFILKLQGVLSFKKAGLLKGIFLLGLPMLCFSAFSFFVSTTQIAEHEFVNPAVLSLVLFTCHMLLIGVFEEFLFRGVILNNMLKKWGKNKSGIIRAVIYSSILFGSAHLVNLIGTSNFVIGTISQLFYTFFLGIFFAAIYIRTKNIWTVVILHAIFDWLAMILITFYPTMAPSGETDVDITILFGQIILTLPFAVFGFLYLRKAWQPKESESIYTLCHNCQTKISLDDEYCYNCGERVKTTCPACSQETRCDAYFCCYCGARLEQQLPQ